RTRFYARSKSCARRRTFHRKLCGKDDEWLNRRVRDRNSLSFGVRRQSEAATTGAQASRLPSAGSGIQGRQARTLALQSAASFPPYSKSLGLESLDLTGLAQHLVEFAQV